MHLRAILALVVLVGLLGYFLYRQDPNAGAPPAAVALFPGVEARDVRAFRIDNAARGYQLKLERDEEGRWAMTDPIAYPAEPSTVGLLLAAVQHSAGLAQDVPDLSAVGLDPPRALLEVTYELDGVEGQRTVELGALDTDSNRVWVRVEGVVQLTLSNIENALRLGVDAFRSRTVAEFEARRVLGFRRAGSLVPYPGEPARSLDFDGLRVDGPVTWVTSRPQSTWLATESVSTFLGALRSVQVARFHDDSFDGPEAYGLDEPALEIELDLAGGEHLVFLFTPDPEDPQPDAAVIDLPWLCMREGYPYVWKVKGEPFQVLTAPAGSFYDFGIGRGSKEDFDRFEVERDGSRLLAVRSGEDWTLTDGSGADSATPGDGERILDALLGVQTAALLEPLPGVAFDAGEELRSYRFAIGEELAWSGRVGARHTTPRGLAGRLVQRANDDLVYLGPESLWEALGVSRAELEGKTALSVSELELTALELLGPDRGRRWVRDGRGRWERADDPGREARELWDVLDRLTGLEVERWLPRNAVDGAAGAGSSALERPIGVRFTLRDGELIEVRVGSATADGVPRVLIEIGERRGVLAEGPDAALHGQLEGLLGQ